jgi:hypothetical protein
MEDLQARQRRGLLRVSKNPNKISEHRRRKCENVQVKSSDDAGADKKSPKDCSHLKSYESFYTCPHCDNPPRKIPYYRLKSIHFGH